MSLLPHVHREPSRRLALRSITLVSLSALLLTLVASFPAGAVISPGDNEDLAEACGLDFVLIVDRSGSIRDAGAEDLVRNAARSFLATLNRKNAGSTASLVSFAGVATPNVTPRLLTDDSMRTFETAVDGLNFDGETNWEDAFVTARNQFSEFPHGSPARPDLVVMITDGNPTTHTGEPEATPEHDRSTGPADIEKAVTEANLIKLFGTHMFAVGVGGTAAAPLNTTYLRAISGPDQLPHDDMSTADWTRVSTFGALQARLTALATALCGGTVVVRKLMDGRAAAGWTFDATGPATPADGATTYAPGGTTSFSYGFDSPDDLAVDTTISERPQPDVALAGASCTEGDNMSVGDFAGGAMHLSISPEDRIKCTFDSRTVQANDDAGH